MDTTRDELLQRFGELPAEDRRMILACANAMIDRSAGRMNETDAAAFEAVLHQEPCNVDAIDEWLIEHGYLAASGE